jgi:hypothetical protein
MLYQYHFDIAASAWIVTLDGYEVHRTMTEAEAADYCDQHNK